MVTEAFTKAAKSYWTALGNKGKLPALEEQEVDAFIELLHQSDTKTIGFHLLDEHTDPYPHIVTGDDRKPWPMIWASSIAELEVFYHPSQKGTYFFLDTIADASGAHRIYSQKNGVRGLASFKSLDQLLLWMATYIEFIDKKITKKEYEKATTQYVSVLDDAWEKSISSGYYIFESLLHAPLPEAWEAYSKGEWPIYESDVKSVHQPKADGSERQFSLNLVHEFLEKRLVNLPPSIQVTKLGTAHRALVDNLTAFEEAISLGLVPEPIRTAAKSKDEVISKRALQWIASHDAWRPQEGIDPIDEEDEEPMSEPEPKTKKRPTTKKAMVEALLGAPIDDIPEDVEPETPFIKKLRVALDEVLTHMVQKEMIELSQDKQPMLLAELIASAANARSAKHMIDKMTHTLVASDHVDELYASDDEIETFFKKLGE